MGLPFRRGRFGPAGPAAEITPETPRKVSLLGRGRRRRGGGGCGGGRWCRRRGRRRGLRRRGLDLAAVDIEFLDFGAAAQLIEDAGDRLARQFLANLVAQLFEWRRRRRTAVLDPGNGGARPGF